MNAIEDKIRILVLATACSLLAGCAGSGLAEALSTPEKLAAEDAAFCQSIGAHPGTPAYTDCRLRKTQMRETRLNADRAAQSSTYQAPPRTVDQPNLLQPMQRAPVLCQEMRTGTISQTFCN